MLLAHVFKTALAAERHDVCPTNSSSDKRDGSKWPRPNDHGCARRGIGTAEHVRWLWASAIVGVHLLPMSICFGPRFAVLGVACIANAALGLLASAVPYEFFGLVDGALKVGFGIVSFLDS